MSNRFGIGWKLHGNGKTITPGTVVAPDERLAWPQTISIGVQHVMAMFGSTVLVPAITGFPATTTLLLLRRRHPPVPGHHRRPGAKLPGFFLCLPRPGFRRHGLRLRHGRRAGRHRGFGCGAVHRRPDRPEVGHGMDPRVDAAGGHGHHRGADRPEPGLGDAQADAGVPADHLRHGACHRGVGGVVQGPAGPPVDPRRPRRRLPGGVGPGPGRLHADRRGRGVRPSRRSPPRPSTSTRCWSSCPWCSC